MSETTVKKTCMKQEKTIVIWACITLVIALLFPLIIWDALGSGAMHFMRYGNVSVAGSSAGDSKATFLFGLGYTLKHMDANTFIPAQLFAAQWRVVLGTKDASTLANNLGNGTLILTILMFASLVGMIAVYITDRHTKAEELHKAVRILSIILACLEAVTVIWFGVIVFTMMGKVDKYSFRIYDFVAYGGVKFLLEVLFNLLLCILNSRLFFQMNKKA